MLKRSSPKMLTAVIKFLGSLKTPFNRSILGKQVVEFYLDLDKN